MATPLQINNLRTLQSCKLVIICAKSAEAVIVKDELHLGTHIPGTDVAELPPGATHDFWLGSLPLRERGSLSYYVTSTSRQGIQSFALEAATLFSILKPTYAIHVGVCAALKDKGFGYVWSAHSMEEVSKLTFRVVLKKLSSAKGPSTTKKANGRWKKANSSFSPT
jgi:hypothetical protein